MNSMFKKNVLKNGLRMITVPIKNSKSCTVLILVGAGSKYETKEINGISHFLEHMFFKGTEKRKNTLKIAEVLDKVGGVYNAFTSKEVTGFWAKTDKNHLDIALDWISDIFLNSRFQEKEIKKEKGVVIEELNMYLDTPTAYIGDLWEELLYKDQPAGWKVIGEKENILKFNRQKVTDYYKNQYSSENTIVCVSGDVDEKTIKPKIEKYFRNILKNKINQKIKVREEQEKPESLFYHKKTDQTHFCLGVRAFDIFHPQKYALVLLSIILGGNMSSRLFINVRERNGLAYYIHTAANSFTDTGYLVTSAGVDQKNLERAVVLTLKEYKSLKDKKIAKEELQKAKDYLKGTLSLSLESSDNQADFYAWQDLLEGAILTPEEKFRRIDQISANDINKVAKEIFVPEKLNMAVIGPFEEKEKDRFNKILKI